ncbi:SnoaL-like domain-containing protein [Agromyces sp. CF514]|uniref:nuclear transport factor 2 family protein n=1 Tax=Agromyces sp. CF514 TaxID=1881031 RepID=UPI0008DF0F1F|nr:nuclear transport factor 2 family protein [Agromyces sp. CF514]SFR66292.1 SnoaL-like domain-containing protein [Agromyces sp. CF514]
MSTAAAIAASNTDAGVDLITDRDRVHLAELVARLGAALDEHRFDVLRELFTDDATATTPGGTAEGRDAVIAQATRNHVGFERLHHVMTNVIVDEGSSPTPRVRTAEVRANLIAHFAHADGVPVQVIGAVYRFGVRETPAGWRIAGLRVTPTWRTGGAGPTPAPVVEPASGSAAAAPLAAPAPAPAPAAA